MKFAILGWTAAVAVALSACGSASSDATASSDAASNTPANAAASPHLLSPEKANGALITLKDLPAGYALQPGDDSDNSEGFCGGALPKTYTNYTAVAFGQSQFGPFAVEGIQSYASEAAAKESFRLAAASTGCGSYKEHDGTTVTIGKLKFPDVGDESLAIASTAGPSKIDLVFVRRGSVTFSVGVVTLGAPPDTDLLEKLTATSLKRIDQAVS